MYYQDFEHNGDLKEKVKRVGYLARVVAVVIDCVDLYRVEK